MEYIRQSWLQCPSQQPYNVSQTARAVHDTSQYGQAKFVNKLLNKTNGFFVECGAGNGQYLSNSLYFERFKGWSGLLIEPNPILYKARLHTHRKAYSLQACLSVNNHAQKLNFVPQIYSGE